MNIPCRIELFGPLRVVQGSRTTTHFRTRRAASLLAYLAYHPGKLHDRADLVDILWPDEDLKEERDSLSTELLALRKSVEPPGIAKGSILIATRNTIRLNTASVTTDIGEFEALAASARPTRGPADRIVLLRQALALYKGRLLEGCHDEWAGREQLVWEERYVDTLLRLAAALEQGGEPGPALEFARRATDTLPYREDAYRAQMHLLGRMARHAEIPRLYADMEQRFQKELSTRPSQATRTLADQMGSGTHPSALLAAASSGSGGAEGAAPTMELPEPLTRFVGRDRELARLEEWLVSGTRLITLVGPGGVGKTRIAVEVASRAARSLGRAVYFVVLADLTDSSLIPAALARVLGLAGTTDASALDRAVQALQRTPTLLVLDNFEHLLTAPAAPDEPAAEKENGTWVVSRLLQRLPRLCCLITSRQPLDLQGEQVFPVEALDVPERADSPAFLLTYPSVALFVDRACLVFPRFSLTEGNAADVASLCRCLEGMPLAIEMAAAWAKTLSPAQMLKRMERQLDLLTSPYRDVPARQRSLRATFAWSFDLLGSDQKAFLAQLSAFRGGCTLEAAEEVCRYPNVADLLRYLQDRSLVISAGSKEQGRFRLLEPVRELAEERLDAGEYRELARRHGDFYLRLADRARAHLDGREAAAWMERLEAEHGNLRVCLDRSLGNGEAEAALRLCITLQQFCWKRGYLNEGRDYSTAVLERCEGDDEPSLLAAALYGSGMLAMMQGDFPQAQACTERSLAIWEEAGDMRGSANALNLLAIIARRRGDFQRAQELLERALPLCRAVGNTVGESACLSTLTNVTRARGDYASSSHFSEQSLALERELGDEQGIAIALNNFAITCKLQGHYARARHLYEESLALRRKLGDRQGIAETLGNLGNIAQEQGDLAVARMLGEQALAILKEIGDARGTYILLNNLGIITQQEGDADAAMHLFRQSLAGGREIGDKSGLAITLGNMGELACTQQDYLAALPYFQECFSVSEEIEDPEGIAQALEGFVVVAIVLGRAEAAVRVAAAAASWRAGFGVQRPPAQRKLYEDKVAQARGTLDPAALAGIRAEGAAMTPAQAAEYIACLRLLEA